MEIYEAEQCWNSLWMNDMLLRNPVEIIERAMFHVGHPRGYPRWNGMNMLYANEVLRDVLTEVNCDRRPPDLKLTDDHKLTSGSTS